MQECSVIFVLGIVFAVLSRNGHVVKQMPGLGANMPNGEKRLVH